MSSSAAVKGTGSGGSGSSGKGKGVSSPEGSKKVDGSGKVVLVSKKKSVTVASKSEVKGKSSSTAAKSVAKTTTARVKAEKKVYSLPGQKHDPPEEREPLRIFYESLSKQIPSSEMAEFWMMEHGLLSPERAKKAYERKQRRQQQLRMGTPIKSTKQEKPESSKKPQVWKNGVVKIKKRVDFSDNDDDFIVKYKKSKG
ncbi:uncharacterized protein [Elaeis guineensis]|uniref:Uncharacterized protein LOC105047348 n=1 Tax=Elaeis guineensis var. tenera TaxID=51953 RepID=A0A6I9RKB5_ELAGV|nr:uncharacterized protein LOC105047348 [Elaeis guineensis]